jgi:hypothetical protein
MEKIKLIRNQPHQKYFLADGTQVAGGSTISKIGDDPAALIAWAHRLGKEGKDYRKVVQEACDVGTLSHFMIEAFLNGFVCDLEDYETELIDKALMCYNKFIDWWDGQELEKVATEIQLVNEKHRYGGTIDLIARSTKGEYILIDFKTSKRISESYWRQCAGYAQLWNCNQPKASKTIDGKECKHIVIGPYQVIPDGVKIDFMESVNQITNHAIVRIGKQDEGDFEVVWKDDLSKEWFVFQKQVELYWALQAAKPEPKPRGRKKK